jgi:hypothetical protein
MTVLPPALSRHVQQKLRAEGREPVDRRSLSVIPTKVGALGVTEAGTRHLWRMYPFIERTRCVMEVGDPEQVRRRGRRCHCTSPRSAFEVLVYGIPTTAMAVDGSRG